MITVAINPFVMRQTPDSPFSHYTGTWHELAVMVHERLKLAEHHKARGEGYGGYRKAGYRNGVILVPLPSKDFRSAIIELTPDTEMVGGYEARQPGEEPRKFLRAKGNKPRAVTVEIVLYSHAVLEEDGDASCNADWEIISINASPNKVEDIPMAPDTLMANHFHLPGGTETHMTDAQFVEALRDSVLYWKDKALCQGNS